MRPYRAVIPLIIVALLLAALPVAAQQWEGSAVLAVRVSNSDGDPIADAQVVARLSEGDPNSGPAPVQTGAGGEGLVSGLAEGEWFVEISHAGYMLYAAYVDLRAGKKPQVGFSSQVNTEESFTPMTVKFMKASPTFNRSAGQTKKKRKAPEVVREAPAPQRSEPPTVVRPQPEAPKPAPPEVVRPPEVAAAPVAEEPTTEEVAAAEPVVVESPEEDDPVTPTQPIEAPEVPVDEPQVEAPSQPAVETPSPSVPAPTSPPAVEELPVVAEEPALAPEPDESAGEEEEGAAAQSMTSEAPTPPAESPVEEAPAQVQPPIQAQPPVQDRATQPPDQQVMPTESDTTPTQMPVTPDPEPAIEALPPAAETAPTEVPEPPTPASDPPTTETPSASASAMEAEAPSPSEATIATSDERAAAPPAPETEADSTPSTPVTSTPGAPTPGTPSTAGRVPRYLRSAAAGSCSECQAGEWAVAAEQVAARSGDGLQYRECSGSFEDDARRGAQLLADAPASRLNGYAGPILTALFRIAPGDQRSQIQSLLSPLTEPESYCQMAGIVLPRSAAFSGYVLEAWDSLGGRSCRANVSCAVGQARWLTEPIIVEGTERIVVYDIFKNRSSRRERRARMTIYFQPPTTDWSPGR